LFKTSSNSAHTSFIHTPDDPGFIVVFIFTIVVTLRQCAIDQKLKGHPLNFRNSMHIFIASA